MIHSPSVEKAIRRQVVDELRFGEAHVGIHRMQEIFPKTLDCLEHSNSNLSTCS